MFEQIKTINKMKVLLFILGLVSAIAGLFLIVSARYTLATETGINQQLIDSEIDKLFYLLMFVGAGMCYAMASVCLLKNWRPMEHKPVLYVAMISAFAFLAGLYYHMIFGSPW